MALTPRARRNRAALFPESRSALQATDPELAEIFDNWALDEIIEDAPLEPRLRLMVQLAALAASHAVAAYRLMLGAALEAGVTPVALREIAYQAVPYAGMGRALDCLQATNEALRERGIGLPLEGQSTTTRETRQAQGLAVQRTLLGALADELIARTPPDQQHIQRHLSANCFGDHLTRGGLDLATRELLTLAMLAALGGCEPQLAAHVTANLAVGNDRRTLIAVVTQVLPFIGYPRALNALRVISETAPS